jgi:hypothetical protein
LYGRVATIELDGQPAVELLEIVVPTHDTPAAASATGGEAGR